MNELLNKLSTYNVFNYLLPGILFAVFASRLTHYSFLQPDLVVGVFTYYFIGMVVSRVGSLVVEPLLKSLRFVAFANYKDYVSATKKDLKIELLSEANNTYRTLCSLFVLLLVVKLYELLEAKIPALESKNGIVLIGFLLVMFLFAYRKQTDYVKKRIKISDS
jgi:hypothetical protein